MPIAPSKPVFIIGSPRSGTTWLYHLLLSSGGFAIYRSETQVYSRFLSAFRGTGSRERRERFLDSWMASEFFLRSGLDPESFRQNLNSSTWTPGEFVEQFMGSICRQQGANRWADCTPDHGLYVRQIKTDFPDALFIHIVRDGRDVSLSLSKQRFVSPLPWGGYAAEVAAAVYWAWITARIEGAGEYLGDDLLTIHYEDLVGSYEETLDRIARFTEKSMDANVIASNPIGSVSRPNTSFAGAQSSKQRDVLRREARANPQLLELLERLIGTELLAFGYRLSAPERPASASEELQRRTLRLRFTLGHFLKSRRLSDLPSLPAGDGNGQGDAMLDPTLRPGENADLIRRIVAGRQSQFTDGQTGQ